MVINGNIHQINFGSEEIIMIDGILQCCYTNTSQEIGGKTNSGWKSVAVSEDIPINAYKKCTEIQTINSTINKVMVDEDGNLLSLYEICGDGTYLYVIRTQYGLTDRLGRPNMFSHAYILLWNEQNVISDPNIFLTIANENFKTSEIAAKKVEKLVKIESFDFNKAIEYSGLNYNTYLILIQCIYVQMSDKKIDEPLFIQYNGTEFQMKAILYCIYYGLPYYLRKNLCMASVEANGASYKNIIFSKYADKHKYYFILNSGDNNLLTPRNQHKILRYGYIDYVVKNLSNPDIGQYFSKLEQYAKNLGDPTASNELILKIAYQMMKEVEIKELDNNELDERLSDALRSKSYTSEIMEKYIAEIIQEVFNRKLILTEENEESLEKWLSVGKTKELLCVSRNYNIYHLNSLSVEQAVRKLGMFNEKEFKVYSQKLAENLKGCNILDSYYSEIELCRNKVTWELLTRVYNDSNFLSSRNKTISKLESLALKLYNNSLLNNSENRIINKNPDYSQYMDFMTMVFGKKKSYIYERRAKKAFWKKVCFQNFSFELDFLYKEMSIDTKKCNCFLEFLNFKIQLIEGRESKFLKDILSFFSEYSDLVSWEIDEIKNKLDELIKTSYRGKDKYFKEWCDIFSQICFDMVNDLLQIREVIYKNKLEQFVEKYEQFLQYYKEKDGYNSFILNVNSSIKDIFLKKDEELIALPLDIWLIIGEATGLNPFNIFDEIDPVLFKIESYHVVCESKLLKRKTYIHEAKKYIQNKGKEYKRVKKWLKELKKIKNIEEEYPKFPFLIVEGLKKKETTRKETSLQDNFEEELNNKSNKKINRSDFF